MTSAAEKEPFELFLQFSRSKFGDNAYVVPEETLQYQRTDLDGGKVSTATLAWDGENIKNGLAELQKENPKKSAFTALGDELLGFLSQCKADDAIEAALKDNRPIRITIRSAAAELYVLPWELTRLEDANKDLAQIADCTIRYTWPTKSKRAIVSGGEPRPEGGRILFAWSHGDEDSVPWNSHLNAIESACNALGGDEKQRREFFQRDIDMVPHATFKEIHTRIERAAQESRPYSIVHLLCHGGMLQGNDGVGLVFTDDDDRKRGFAADGRQVNDVNDLKKVTVSPDTLTTLFDGADKQEPRLLVLCACLGSAMDPGSHLGSVALAIHRTGIESVIASRFLLSKPGSTILAEAVYGSLLGRADSPPTSLEDALRIARAKLRVDNSATSDYAAIQLFQNTIGWDTRPVVFRPYRGLLTFGLEHRRYFFGRDPEIKETVEDLGALVHGTLDNSGHRRPRFLIVAAASGTGKSSMVFAGALPKLIETHHFEWAKMRPVADPIAALNAVLGTCKDSAKPFLVIVDQFEEVFTQIEKPEQRTEFVRALWQHASGDSGISVIVTLRVDFLGRCKEILLDDKTGLRLEGVVYDEAFRVWVRQMDRAALEEIIQKPADLVGIRFDEGLVVRVLDDAGLEPGALPLVEYTLDQLWQSRVRKNGREGLTWDTYNTLGGVTGALAKKADSILAGFDEMGKRAARRLLVQLVDMREEAALDTRRRVRKDELHPGPGVDEKAFGDVLETFTRERLVVVGNDDAANAVDSVEIAHEQLVRSWGTLRGWLNEDRQRVLECALLEEWVKTARGSTTFVLQGDLLAQARTLQAKYRDELGAEATSLIKRSEKAEARTKRLRRLAAIAIAVTAVVMAGLAVVAWTQTKEAKTQTAAAEDASALATKNAEEAQNNAMRARDNALMAGAREFLTVGAPWHAALLLAEVNAPEKARGWFELATSALESGGIEATFRHDGPVWDAAWSPDGKRIVTASGKEARVWNADGSSDPVVLKGHTDKVYSVEWSPEGKRIVTGSADTTARVWNANGSGKPVVLDGDDPVVFDGIGGAVNSAAWSPDGKRILTTGGYARVWNADGLGKPLELTEHPAGVDSAAWSPDGKHIVTASYDKTARVWNADDLDKPLAMKARRDGVNSAAWSPNGKLIVTASDDEPARVWNADWSGKPLELKDYTGKVHSAAWSPDGHRIVTVSFDPRVVSVWSADEGTRIDQFDYADSIVSASFSPDGKRILTASDDGIVRVSSADSGGRLVVFRASWKRLNGVAWSPDGKRILTASHDTTARVWNANGSGNPIVVVGTICRWSPDGKRIVMLSERSGRVSNADGSGDLVLLDIREDFIGARWSPDGKRLVMLSSTECVVTNADGLGEPVVLQNDNKPVGCPRAWWSPDGKRIVTASDDTTARVWYADGLGEPLVLKGHEGVVGSAAWSPDGKHIVTASVDKTARVWNADGSGEARELKGHTETIVDVAWSPDGKRIVTASYDNTARVWDVDAAAEPLYNFKNHTADVNFTAWSPDGTRIVTASDDKTAQVWNADGSGTPVILRHQDIVRSAAWSPNGKRIVTTSYDDTIRVWNADGTGDPWVIKASGPASWTPDGTRILTGSGTDEARSYLVDLKLLQQALRNATTDCLTPAERETYLLESESNARKAYATCETKNGRTPAPATPAAP